MTRKFIDISVPLESNIKSDPPGFEPKINYFDHDKTVPEMVSFFPGLTKEDLPDGKAWAYERIDLITHNGTHLDAPYHFHPTMNNGERAITIDEVPLEWCMQAGVKLDFRHFPAGYIVTQSDIETELKRISHQLSPLEIVLVNTSAGVRYGKDDYIVSGCGLGREATLYLLEQGIKVCGTDAWSWDPPFSYTKERFQQTGDASLIWEG
ncbi:MAG: cyclase family protein, partial [Gammaproteobacteria bacterium]|nr:cyclase family protein [Gammaproteobacteria bacterium]